MGKNIILLLMVTGVSVIFISGEVKKGATSSIIKQVGGSGSSLIAAIQGRPVTESAF